MATHSSTLAGEFHGRRSLVGYSPWGCKESETYERLHFHFQWLLLLLSRSVVSDSVRPHGLQPTRLLRPWDSPARVLEWVAISFSNAWKWKVKVKSLSRSQLLATPWTAAYQAPPSLGFSRQEYWSGVPLPSQWLQLTSVKHGWVLATCHWHPRCWDKPMHLDFQWWKETLSA